MISKQQIIIEYREHGTWSALPNNGDYSLRDGFNILFVVLGFWLLLTLIPISVFASPNALSSTHSNKDDQYSVLASSAADTDFPSTELACGLGVLALLIRRRSRRREINQKNKGEKHA